MFAKISGFGSFPIDMLRYDSCVPMTERDAQLIGETFSRVGSWEIYVRRVKSGDFTYERWTSFGSRIETFKNYPLLYTNRKEPEWINSFVH